MLYLVSPNRDLRWIDLPPQLTLAAAREHGVDLGGLDWLAAERKMERDIVRLALRFGHECSAGIVISAVDLSEVGRAEELERLQRESVSARSALANSEQLMEALAPGWIADSERLNAEVDASIASTIDESRTDLQSMLDRSPDDGLMLHWVALGGALPDPR